MYHGIIVKTHYAQYTENGITYPAYCLDKTKQDVNDSIIISLYTQWKKFPDVKLGEFIINAYPYKTIEELGCKDKGEAYTATKQAIYCYIHGNNPNDYSGIGEAGKRTVNALHKILNDAENCTDTQISNTLQIIKEYQNFKIDDKEKEYVSKIYSIKAGTKINKYSIDIEKIEKELPEGIKITDINNNSKKEFEQNEKFKILIPIKNMTQRCWF